MYIYIYYVYIFIHHCHGALGPSQPRGRRHIRRQRHVRRPRGHRELSLIGRVIVPWLAPERPGAALPQGGGMMVLGDGTVKHGGFIATKWWLYTLKYSLQVLYMAWHGSVGSPLCWLYLPWSSKSPNRETVCFFFFFCKTRVYII